MVIIFRTTYWPDFKWVIDKIIYDNNKLISLEFKI